MIPCPVWHSRIVSPLRGVCFQFPSLLSCSARARAIEISLWGFIVNAIFLCFYVLLSSTLLFFPSDRIKVCSNFGYPRIEVNARNEHCYFHFISLHFILFHFVLVHSILFLFVLFDLV